MEKIKSVGMQSGAQRYAQAIVDLNIACIRGYPGTPSTAVFEAIKRIAKPSQSIEWSINEKVALEEAAGSSVVGARSLCIMKHYGLNVCSDFLAALSLGDYLPGGLVVIVADDPGGHSSRSEQDSRNYGKIFGVPVLEPSALVSPFDVLDSAYHISEAFNLPVIIRLATRLIETWLPVSTVQIHDENNQEPVVTLQPFKKTVFSSPAPKYHNIQQEKMDKISQVFGESSLNRLHKSQEVKSDTVIVASGRAATLVQELLSEDMSFIFDVLFLTTVFPFPLSDFYDSLIADYEKVVFVEEGDAFVESEILSAMALSYSRFNNKKMPEIYGKKNKKVTGQSVPGVGELNKAVLREELSRIGSDNARGIDSITYNERKINGHLCSGCPHSSSLYIINRIKKFFSSDISVVGDVGCYTMGVGEAGYNVFDIAMCMGASISMALGIQGQYELNQEGGRAIAVIGDSTLFHAGLPALVQARSRNIPLVVLVLDNSVTAMTGGQKTVSSEVNDIASIVDGIGIHCREINPYDIPAAEAVLMDALSGFQTEVIIMKAPCALFAGKGERQVYEVNEDLCVGESCGCNFSCQKEFLCPALSISELTSKSVIDSISCTGCGACESLCPTNAITLKPGSR